MSTLKPNAEQAAIIADLGRDLVVSAGAGTGKTATMARRFAHAVTADEAGERFTGLERVLAITFTRKAAAELSERVRRVLVLEHPDGVPLARRIDEAWISTIDAFCSRIVRRHALEAGVPPEFGIADDVRAGTMRGAALDAVLARARAEGGAAAELIVTFGDAAVRACLGDAYDRMRAMGAETGELEVAEASLEDAAEAMMRAIEDLRGAIAECGRDNATLQGDLAACAEIASAVEDALRLPPVERGAALIARLPGSSRKTFKKASVPPELVDAAEEAKEALRVAATGDSLAPLLAALKDLLAAFDAEYTSAKVAEGLLDHSDVTRAAARLFGERPGIAKRYREQFRLLMIDEFQDTNGVQMAVFAPLRDGDLCVVGDDKQSIYGFRYADVEIFRALRDEIGHGVPLRENFRSHPEVLEFVNRVFGSPAVFGDGLTPLAAHRPEGPSESWPGGPRVEVLAVRGSTLGERVAEEVEAEVIAERVAALRDAGVAANDIVVLLRGMPDAVVYASALRAAGVPVHVASGESFFTSPAVEDLRALLKVLVVPADDGALVRVLAGRLVRLGDDALLAVRRAASRGPMWAALPAAAAGSLAGVTAGDAARLAAFLAAAGRLRAAASRIPVATLLHEACAALDYDLTLLASGVDGPREWRNVLKLVRMAGEWDDAGRGDAGAFLDYLDLCERYAASERSAPLAGEGSAVRIMTIHSAKGLEFPVVFLARAHSALTRDDRSVLRVERVDGRPLLVCRHPDDGSAHEGAPGPRAEEVRRLARERGREEELRIGYVACTRAREALFVTGVAKGKDDVPGPDILLGVLHEALGSPAGDAAPWRRVAAPDARAVEDARPDAGPRECPAVAPELPASAPPSPVPLPATVSFTSLAEHERCAFGFYARRVLGILPLPSDTADAAALGSAVHDVLRLDGRLPASEAIAAAVRRHGLDGEGPVRTCAEAYAASPTAAEVATADRVHREQPFSLDMGAVRLVGSVDLIAWKGDSALIVDYKTGARDPDAATPGRYELQARCYAAAAFAAGARDVTVRFLWLPSGEMDEVAFALDAAGVLLEGLRAEVARIGRDGYPVRDGGFDREVCGACPVLGGLCPVDPPKGRRR